VIEKPSHHLPGPTHHRVSKATLRDLDSCESELVVIGFLVLGSYRWASNSSIFRRKVRRSLGRETAEVLGFALAVRLLRITKRDVLLEYDAVAELRQAAHKKRKSPSPRLDWVIGYRLQTRLTQAC